MSHPSDTLEGDLICPQCGSTFLQKPYALESPVPTIIDTNRIPSNDEAAKIRRMMHEIEPEILRLEQEMNDMQSTLMRLKNEHLRLQQFRAKHSALLTPARTLPHEVLAEIFIHCLVPFRDLCTYETSPTPRGVPLYLGQICSRWRVVALSISKLWANFVIGFHGNKILDCHAEHDWIARSNDQPLEFCICWTTTTWRQPQYIDLITPWSVRWYDVNLHMGLADAQRLAAVKGNLPLLRYLDLEIFYRRDKPMGNHSLDIFEIAPQLRQLALSCITSGTVRPLAPSSLKLPWTQLIQLELRHCTLKESLDILRKCHNIVEYKHSLDADETREGEEAPYAVSSFIHLPHLRHLFVHLKVSSSSGVHLDHLVTPDLQSVHIYGSHTSIDGPHVRLIALLQRSPCRVRSLSLQNIYISDTQLIDYLDAMPELMELDIQDSETLEIHPVSMKLIWRLTAGNPVGVLAPKLHKLRVRMLVWAPEQYQHFVNMIRSRWDAAGENTSESQGIGIVPLRHVRLHHMRRRGPVEHAGDKKHTAEEFPLDVFSQLDGLKTVGLNIWVEET